MLQTALKLSIFEKFVPLQCERVCRGPGIQNFYHHDREQVSFYKKKYISKQRADEGCSCNLYIARNEEFKFIWEKTALKRTSNVAFSRKKVDLDES